MVGYISRGKCLICFRVDGLSTRTCIHAYLICNKYNKVLLQNQQTEEKRGVQQVRTEILILLEGPSV